MFKKRFISMLVLLMTAVTGAWADGERTSHWPDFSPENYEKNNTLVAGIMIDGVIITADYDGWDQLEVAPFIGDECRCVHGESASYLYNGYVQEYGDPFPVLDGMLIFYNGEGGDEVTFKMYNHATGVEYTACAVTYLGDPITIKTGDEHMEGWDDPENPVFLNFTTPEPAAPAAYTVSMKEGTEDATSWTIAPAEATTTGVEAGTTVTATYSGTKRVKSVKAKKKAAAPAYTMAAAATTSDKGKLICTAGHIHVYGEDAACTAGRVAKIIYVGPTGHATYNHGLALALEDMSTLLTWDNSGANNDGKTAAEWCSAWNTSKPVTDAEWLLASKDQWNYMLGTNGAGSSTTLLDGFTSVGGSNLESQDYWSSTEYESNTDEAWMFNFGYDWWYDTPKNRVYPLVRACLAF